jgi:DNA-binding response OmpR family regulator
MSHRPVLLLVDDDDFAADLAAEALSANYEVRHAADGPSALAAIGSEAPDLVLLDVSMPGMNGYDVCRAIRGELGLDELPVIFLSGMVGADERLAGYDAGGNDYLTKPPVPGELRTKVAMALQLRRERQQLKSDLSSAFTTAMTAMSSAAETGEVLQFLRRSFACADYAALAYEMLRVIQAYGLNCSAQVRGAKGTVTMGAEGPCSPLEEAVHRNMSQQGRIIDFGARTSFSYERASIIVRNMPTGDPDRYGRMKDNLALLVEGADARVTSLDAGIALDQQRQAVLRLLDRTRRTLQEIGEAQQTQRIASARIMQDFRDRLEKLLLSLGLTDSQEAELGELAQETSREALALYDQGVTIDAHMAAMMDELNNAGAA